MADRDLGVFRCAETIGVGVWGSRAYGLGLEIPILNPKAPKTLNPKKPLKAPLNSLHPEGVQWKRDPAASGRLLPGQIFGSDCLVSVSA